MTPVLAAALAGLVGSPHCVGMCGGFATAAGGPWHAGRLTTYAGLGALAGLGGRWFPGNAWVVASVSAVLLAWFTARLAGWVPALPFHTPGLVSSATRLGRIAHPLGRYGLGLATGLLPCGLTWSAMALALAAGTPQGGALSMVAFGAGTLPALTLAAGWVRRLGPRFRPALALTVLGLGLWSIGTRAMLPVTVDGPICHTPEVP